MRSHRTGSRSIRALPPTLPPAISTCASRYVKFENSEEAPYGNRTGVDRAGRHHDHRSVGQAELFLPARGRVSRKGPLRPPTGSAAPARRERARGLWGTYYYGITSRWSCLGPVNAGARAAAADTHNIVQ